MKSRRLVGSILIFCILILHTWPCHAQQYSPRFQALLNQIQQTYLAPKGENISLLRSQYPAVLATLVGHALRQQRVHVQQNPSLSNQFMNLQREAQIYIGEVALTTSARFDYGSRMTQQDLWYIVDRAYQGQDDAWIWQNFRVRTGTMPSVLVARSGPQKRQLPVYDLPLEEKEEIDLLRRVAPPVQGPDNCDGPTYWSPQCEWYRKQKEAQIKAESQKSKALNPDGIQGNWSTSDGKTQLRIWKQGDTYLGSMSGEQVYLRESFKPNEICLRLKYAGAGKDGPIFKGQYHRAKGLSSSWVWENVTFYYYLSAGTERLGEKDSVAASFRFKRP